MTGNKRVLSFAARFIAFIFGILLHSQSIAANDGDDDDANSYRRYGSKRHIGMECPGKDCPGVKRHHAKKSAAKSSSILDKKKSKSKNNREPAKNYN